MTVAKFTQPDFTSQDAATYKANVDAAIFVAAHNGAGFAPRAQDTPDMTIRIDPGAIQNRATGAVVLFAGGSTAAITAPGAGTSKIVRVYVDEFGALGKVEGTAAASPVAPSYPPGVFPCGQATIASSTTSITNAMLTDERAWNSGYGTPRNTFLIRSSQTFPAIPDAWNNRISAGGATAGAGGGCTNAGGTSHAGGGASSSAGTVWNRWFAPEALSIVIGAKGLGGAGGAANGSNGTIGGAAGTTTITGVSSGNVISIAASSPGGAATAATPTAGTGGAAGAAPTNGTAGTVGGNGTTGASAVGGAGPGCGVGAVASPKSPGGTISPDARNGTNADKSSGAGGGVGTGGKGGDGSDGWVLVEVF